MGDFAILSGVDFPCDAVHQCLGRHQLRRHIGQHKFDTLKCVNRLIKLNPLLRVVGGYLGRTRSATQGVCGNLQSCLDKPVFGELKTLSDLSQYVGLIHRNLVHLYLRMIKSKIVHEMGGTYVLDTGVIDIDQEQGRLIRVIIHVGVHDDKITSVE